MSQWETPQDAMAEARRRQGEAVAIAQDADSRYADHGAEIREKLRRVHVRSGAMKAWTATACAVHALAWAVTGKEPATHQQVKEELGTVPYAGYGPVRALRTIAGADPEYREIADAMEGHRGRLDCHDYLNDRSVRVDDIKRMIEENGEFIDQVDELVRVNRHPVG